MSTNRQVLPSPPETPEEREANPNVDTCDASRLSWVRCEFEGQENVNQIQFVPPVVIPSLGHVELDCRDDMAIVRTYFACGELAEVRLVNVLVRDGETVRVIQVESKVRA
jgi:hypothetical protein